MNKIVKKEILSENVVLLEVEAPLIAKARKAGHFVIVKIGKFGERIPLTIAASNLETGTITLVIQKVGVSSRKITDLEVGDEITDLVGPLGKATHIEHFGTVVCACGGVGTAPMLPIAEAMKKAGNRVITVQAARTKDLIILEDQISAFSDEV
ncbi:MAG: sulfide/dihydroorotate dehydrogenase-like FAD/NAD-binding protein, partial [Dysgonamonadaceae bacterium]|nr:sulfide/dihydroorotate dehydrogenase-like FAD/NAD-binding protein [Dysgonamonadaceae bacterium]